MLKLLLFNALEITKRSFIKQTLINAIPQVFEYVDIQINERNQMTELVLSLILASKVWFGGIFDSRYGYN